MNTTTPMKSNSGPAAASSSAHAEEAGTDGLPIGWDLDLVLNPRMSEWIQKKISVFADRNWTEECQGITTDGQHWYITGGIPRRIYRKTLSFDGLGSLTLPDGYGDHMGDLDFDFGRRVLHIPLEPYGYIWKVRPLPSPTMFDEKLQSEGFFKLGGEGHQLDANETSWCAVNPLDGLLYSSALGDAANGRLVETVYGYDPDDGYKLVRTLPLNYHISGVQGGFISRNGWLYLTSMWSNEIICFDTRTGSLLGRRSVSASDELEGIVNAHLAFGDGTQTWVSVLDLVNDVFSNDDVKVRHFWVPDAKKI